MAALLRSQTILASSPPSSTPNPQFSWWNFLPQHHLENLEMLRMFNNDAKINDRTNFVSSKVQYITI